MIFRSIDHHAAALYVAGIVAALFARERTGQGRRVDVNLLQAAVDLQGESITAWLNGAPHDSPRGVGGVASWFRLGAYGIPQPRDCREASLLGEEWARLCNSSLAS